MPASPRSARASILDHLRRIDVKKRIFEDSAHEWSAYGAIFLVFTLCSFGVLLTLPAPSQHAQPIYYSSGASDAPPDIEMRTLGQDAVAAQLGKTPAERALSSASTGLVGIFANGPLMSALISFLIAQFAKVCVQKSMCDVTPLCRRCSR